ncbi:hypothetical protein HYT25_00025 [Candidatus Pacearchaeota archaeon]|nr:hypothetical protein [Candidatus Pacearchaeota archaeon]
MNLRTKITLIILTLILVGTLTIVLGQVYITGNVVEDNFQYSFTKAICDENNYCEDYEVVCSNNEISKLTPTGFGVQFPEQWKDPRNKDDVEIRC